MTDLYIRLPYPVTATHILARTCESTLRLIASADDGSSQLRRCVTACSRCGNRGNGGGEGGSEGMLGGIRTGL